MSELPRASYECSIAQFDEILAEQRARVKGSASPALTIATNLRTFAILAVDVLGAEEACALWRGAAADAGIRAQRDPVFIPAPLHRRERQVVAILENSGFLVFLGVACVGIGLFVGLLTGAR